LVKLYLEFERESVNDALVSIEAEDCVRDILGHADIASVKELEQAQTVLAHYKDRLTSCLQKREKIIQNLQESLERETRALKQNGKDVQECEKNLEQIQALLDGKSNLTPRKRSIS
jgi:prefoldin subunit 5